MCKIGQYGLVHAALCVILVFGIQEAKATPRYHTKSKNYKINEQKPKVSGPNAVNDKIGSIVTGPKSGTYIVFGRDIARVLSTSAVKIDVKESGGSIDNIKRITGKENAILGIVQSDVLGFLSRSKNPDSINIAKSLRMIYPFYQEEVHVLARNGIQKFSDLQGKKITIGEEGSGSMLTAVNLFAMMHVEPKQTLKLPPAEGVVAVLRGEVDAAIFVSGKPVKLFKNLETLKDSQHQKYANMLKEVHFIPLNAPKMLDEYRGAEITPNDYGFVKEKISTIAVTSVLITYDYSSGGAHYNEQRCELVRTIAKAIRDHLPQLKENGHDKWKEVNLDADPGIWQKDSCAWPPTTTPQEAQDLTDILKKE